MNRLLHAINTYIEVTQMYKGTINRELIFNIGHKLNS